MERQRTQARIPQKGALTAVVSTLDGRFVRAIENCSEDHMKHEEEGEKLPRDDRSTPAGRSSGVECSMCGDVGFVDLLQFCSICQSRAQHLWVASSSTLTFLIAVDWDSMWSSRVIEHRASPWFVFDTDSDVGFGVIFVRYCMAPVSSRESRETESNLILRNLMSWRCSQCRRSKSRCPKRKLQKEDIIWSYKAATAAAAAPRVIKNKCNIIGSSSAAAGHPNQSSLKHGQRQNQKINKSLGKLFKHKLSRRSNCDSKLLTRRYKSLSELSCWQQISTRSLTPHNC